jgi:hypothetical protein
VVPTKVRKKNEDSNSYRVKVFRDLFKEVIDEETISKLVQIGELRFKPRGV